MQHKMRMRRTWAAVLAAIFALAALLPLTAGAAGEDGWVSLGEGKWSYYTKGSTATGWVKDNGKWYYMNASGIMQTGWIQEQNKAGESLWYYLKGNGEMQIGWLQDGTDSAGLARWYYLKPGGDMATGWVRHGGEWYLMDSSGLMLRGWAQWRGNRYYLQQNGKMARGTLPIGQDTYSFRDSGELIGQVQPPAHEALPIELEVIAIMNEERAKEGLPALEYLPIAGQIARYKSKDMADNNYFDHNSPTYGEWKNIAQLFGFTYYYLGENIAKGQPTAAIVMNSWMNSEGHRNNIMSTNFTHIGVGYYVDANGTPYWTQTFCRPR